MAQRLCWKNWDTQSPTGTLNPTTRLWDTTCTHVTSAGSSGALSWATVLLLSFGNALSSLGLCVTGPSSVVLRIHPKAEFFSNYRQIDRWGTGSFNIYLVFIPDAHIISPSRPALPVQSSLVIHFHASPYCIFFTLFVCISQKR